MMMTEKKKLIYIAGHGRSGSTLLSALLSEADGCLSIGEPINLWSAGLKVDKCSCGEHIMQCSFWGTVFKKYFQVNHWADISIIKNTKPLWKIKDTLGIILKGSNFVSQEYLENLKNLYLALYEQSKKETLIDESKFFSYLYALKLTEAFEIKVIHLVRDPRAVAFSWQRNKIQQTIHMRKIPWHRTALRWVIEQFILFIFLKSLPQKNKHCIKYEDLINNPQLQLEELKTTFNLSGNSIFISPTQFLIKNRNHFVISNPSMPHMGENAIRKDFEWKEKMPVWAKMLVTLICWPMMLVYGYPIFSDHA